MGEVADFLYAAAPRPNIDIALAGAVGFLSGVCGKAYNTYTNAGLNQYILVLGKSGLGKETIASDIGKILKAVVANNVPAAAGFMGPELISAAGTLKWLDKNPSIISLIPEAGYKLKAFSSPKVNLNDDLLKRALLDLYAKSAGGSIVNPMAYSDRDKHTAAIVAPALTVDRRRSVTPPSIGANI